MKRGKGLKWISPACLYAGLLVPDIPLEETHAVRVFCDKHGIELVLLATPTTPLARMADIAKASQVCACV